MSARHKVFPGDLLISNNNPEQVKTNETMSARHKVFPGDLLISNNNPEQEAVNRYGKENVETIGNKHIRITHKNFGWSGDDKNVDGYLINPYSSQTTAHMRDYARSKILHCAF